MNSPTYSVDWSYPTSTNAKRFNFPILGCWTVSRTNRNRKGEIMPPVAISGHARKDDAEQAAQALRDTVTA